MNTQISNESIWPWSPAPRRTLRYFSIIKAEGDALMSIRKLCPEDCDIEIRREALTNIGEIEEASKHCDLLIAEVRPTLELEALNSNFSYKCTFFSKKFPSAIGTDQQELGYEELMQKKASLLMPNTPQGR